MASDYATGFVREPRVPAVAYARLVESLRHPTLSTAWPMRTPRQQWFGGISVFQDPLHTYSYLGSSQNKFTRSPAETGANCNHRKSHRAGKSKYKQVSIPDAAEVTMNSFRFITEQVYFVVFCRTNILLENFDCIELSVGVKALYNQPVPPKDPQRRSRKYPHTRRRRHGSNEYDQICIRENVLRGSEGSWSGYNFGRLRNLQSCGLHHRHHLDFPLNYS